MKRVLLPYNIPHCIYYFVVDNKIEMIPRVILEFIGMSTVSTVVSLRY